MHIIYTIESSSDDFDEEQIKAIRLIIFERAIWKMYFCGSDFQNVFLKKAFFKLRE